MAKRGRRKGRRGGRRGAGRPALSGVSIQSLQAEIERRRNKSGAMHRMRDRMLRRLAKIEAKILAAGGELVSAVSGRRGSAGGGAGGSRRGRGRAKNAQTLVEVLQRVLRGKTLSVTDAAAAVQRAGYRSKSKTFRTIVNQALIKRRDMFKNVSRGQYTAS